MGILTIIQLDFQKVNPPTLLLTMLQICSINGEHPLGREGGHQSRFAVLQNIGCQETDMQSIMSKVTASVKDSSPA